MEYLKSKNDNIMGYCNTKDDSVIISIAQKIEINITTSKRKDGFTHIDITLREKQKEK